MEKSLKEENKRNEFLNHKRNSMEPQLIDFLNPQEKSRNQKNGKCGYCSKQTEITLMKQCINCKNYFCLTCAKKQNQNLNEFICETCQKNNIQKNTFNKGICIICRKEEEIIKFKSVDDVFKYLETNLLYKNEFADIKSKSQGMKFKIEKLICKNCLNKIKTEGNDYLIKIFDLKNKNSLIKIEEQNFKFQNTSTENQTRNFHQINPFLNNQTPNQNINQQTFQQIHSPSNFLNQNNLQLNSNAFPQNSFLIYKNFSYNPLNNQNLLLKNFYEQPPNVLNYEMLFQQLNPNDNIPFPNNLNISTGINPLNLNFNSINEEDKKGIDVLEKQINTMRLCNQLQKNSLDVLYQYITEFYKEVEYHQKINEYQKSGNSIYLNNNNQLNFLKQINPQYNQNNSLNNFQSMFNQQLKH
jgi:hypothetical protein